MSVALKKETREFILDTNYEINFVNLEKKEEEHTHQFIELVYTIKGRGIHKIDGKEYHVGTGDMLVINYHCRHEVIPIDNLYYVDVMLKPEYVNETLRGTEDLFLLLSLSDFSDLSNHIIKENIMITFDGEDKKKIEFLIDWTREEQKNAAAAGNLIMFSALSMMLSLVFRKMAQKQGARLALNDQLLFYIERNCASGLNIGKIASMCGYSSEHFSRAFRKYTGKSPMEYVSECRIKKAKLLLLETDKPIELIISECGFSNRTAFFKNFRKKENQTPLQFRKNQN